MSVFVRLIDGTQLAVDINVDTTLEDIADDIKHYIKNPKFTYQGEVLTDHKETLADLGICPESTINVDGSYKFYILHGTTDGRDCVYYIIDEKRKVIYNISVIEDITYCNMQSICVMDGNIYTYRPYDYPRFITTIIIDDEITVNDSGEDVQPYINSFKEVNSINIKLDMEHEERERDFINQIKHQYPELDITVSSR